MDECYIYCYIIKGNAFVEYIENWSCIATNCILVGRLDTKGKENTHSNYKIKCRNKKNPWTVHGLLKIMLKDSLIYKTSEHYRKWEAIRKWISPALGTWWTESTIHCTKKNRDES